MGVMTNQTVRVLELIKRFNNGQKVCIDALKNESLWQDKSGTPLSERTIRRDLDVIKDAYPGIFELIRGESGCYKSLTKKTFQNFLSPQNISLLVQAFSIAQRANLFDGFDIDRDDRTLLEKKIKEYNKIYLFKNKPFEEVKDRELFAKLEEAIKYQKYITIRYGNNTHKIKPYKILFMQENFYLASEVKNEHIYTPFRISEIKSIEIHGEEFHKDPQLVEFIEKVQTPFAKFGNKTFEVILKINEKKAKYFKKKKFLASQKIIETKPDGSLLLSYTITQDIEIKDLIKQWIPHLKIIKPISLKELMRKDLEEFLKNI